MAGSTVDAAVKGNALRRAGALAGIVAGPLFLVSAQLSSRASLGYLHELAGNSTAASRSPTTSRLIVILAVAVRDRLPRRRASSFAVVQLAFWGGAAARRLQGRYADAQWRKSRDQERVGSRDRVLVDQRPGCLRRCPWLSRCGVVTQAGDPSRSFLSRPVRFHCFLILPWGNATFLMAIVTLFGWITCAYVREVEAVLSSTGS
ncbi:MAG TPA: hypothetical protein VNT27_06010 [Propionibacteriaceae bacterium]|nr:hypothetical protein [Propionibacteriaceae bacterium]